MFSIFRTESWISLGNSPELGDLSSGVLRERRLCTVHLAYSASPAKNRTRLKANAVTAVPPGEWITGHPQPSSLTLFQLNILPNKRRFHNVPSILLCNNRSFSELSVERSSSLYIMGHPSRNIDKIAAEAAELRIAGGVGPRGRTGVEAERPLRTKHANKTTINTSAHAPPSVLFVNFSHMFPLP